MPNTNLISRNEDNMLVQVKPRKKIAKMPKYNKCLVAAVDQKYNVT